MRIVGQGRIVVWEGASLWLLHGEAERAELLPHAHHAVQLTFRLDGWFELEVEGGCLSGPVAAVWSDVRHTFKASGVVGFLFVAPESSVGRTLRAMLGDRTCANLASAALFDGLAALRSCCQRGCTHDDLLQIGKAMIAALPAADGATLPDRRVVAMIAFARQQLEHRITLAAAADHVHLSASRARHLFALHTGLPFKAFVLWLRLECAVEQYAKGISLTEAAHSAGFADSAHFSRTFRRTFGLPAAMLRLSHE